MGLRVLSVFFYLISTIAASIANIHSSFADGLSDEGCFVEVGAYWQLGQEVPPEDLDNEGLVTDPNKQVLGLGYPVISEKKLTQTEFKTKKLNAHSVPSGPAGRLGLGLRKILRKNFSSITTLVHFYDQQTEYGTSSINNGGGLVLDWEGETIKAESVQKVTATFLVEFCDPNTLIPHRDKEPPICMETRDIRFDISPCLESEGICPQPVPVPVEPDPPAPLPRKKPTPRKRPVVKSTTPAPQPASKPTKAETMKKITELMAEFPGVVWGVTINTDLNSPSNTGGWPDMPASLNSPNADQTALSAFMKENHARRKKLIEILNQYPNIKVVMKGYSNSRLLKFGHAYPGTITTGGVMGFFTETKPRARDPYEAKVSKLTGIPANQFKSWGVYYTARSLAAAIDGKNGWFSHMVESHPYRVTDLLRPNQIECQGSSPDEARQYPNYKGDYIEVKAFEYVE